MKARILVVDDEIAIQRALVKFFETQKYDVSFANDGAEAIEKIKNAPFDLVISDLKMPSMTGVELIRQAKKIQPDCAYIIMTGFGTIESAIEAIKEGAFHYITKPFELDDVDMLVKKAISYRRLQTNHERLTKQVTDKFGFDNIIGASDTIKSVFEMIQKVANSDATVLILGESGTGKELIAKAIHFNSDRSQEPLIAVNCAAIPENLLESELFGYVKGAFTGAVQSREGKFSAARGGTIFLDEIGDMSPKLQVKILRVLQEKRYEPVGSTESIDADVRIITATHRDLEELVREGKFREDLYYRLNVIPINVPPLRERVSDIPLLVKHFLNVYAKQNAVTMPILAKGVEETFLHYRWPGNIRELENTIERLVVLHHGKTVTTEELPDKFLQASGVQIMKAGFTIPDNGISLKDLVDDFENTLIVKALDKTNWNKNRAATLLQLNRTTLVEKIKKKNITRGKPFGDSNE